MPEAYNPWGAPVFPTADDNAMQPETFVPQGVQDWTRQAAPKDYNILSQIAGSLGKALMYPGQVAQSQTPISTEDMVGPAFNLAGMLTLGAGAAPQEANALNMGIKAYHGSPHDFDKFDLSKIGTGEGAQAYGHGLYFADNEGVARSYRDALSKQVNVSGSQLWSHPHDSPLATTQHSIVGDVANGIDPAEAIATQAAKWRQEAEPYRKFALENPEHAAEALQNANNFEEIARCIEKQNPSDYVKNPGHMYEVNINADPSHFLDWDQPLSPDVLAKVQAAAQNIKPNLYERMMGEGKDLAKWALQPENVRPGLTGESAVGSLKRGLGSDAAASQALREAGIPGIKYLDQGSRGAGEGSSNYVVFNHDLIDIMRKYAVPGMLGAPILANALSEQKT